MQCSRYKRGKRIDDGVPIWAPLIALASDHVIDFMWTHEVELEDGTHLHAYKHRETQRYLHLDHEGHAFTFIWGKEYEGNDDPRYEEVPSTWLLDFALARSDERAKIFRQNVAAEFTRICWARSATKHRISRKRIRYAIENSRMVFEEDPPPGRPWATETRLVFLGQDAMGTPLEIIAAVSEKGNVTVIHAMKLRKRYRFAMGR